MIRKLEELADRDVSTYCTFRVVTSAMSVSDISGSLQLLPNEYHNKGDIKKGDSLWKKTYWGICSKYFVESDKLEDHIIWIIEKLLPFKDKILSLMKQDSASIVDIICYFNSDLSNTGIFLSQSTLRQLNNLELDLYLDIY